MQRFVLIALATITFVLVGCMGPTGRPAPIRWTPAMMPENADLRAELARQENLKMVNEERRYLQAQIQKNEVLTGGPLREK